MNDEIKFVQRKQSQGAVLSSTEAFSVQQAAQAQAFHSSFPEYAPTPLVQLDNLAARLGVDKIFVKDESYRFGLNAFKVLGGSYCVGNYLAKKLGVDIAELTYADLVSAKVREKLQGITFVTATDGNHGRGIAWVANRLGCKSVVYMPKGSAAERLANIRALGAEASITDLNYDDAVRKAKADADKYGWVVLQDTSWEGYEEAPTWIMQGYTTMAYEATQQLQGAKPTHIFLQAGVGAMAGAVTGYFASLYTEEERPIIVIVEPELADCIYRTAKAADGTLHNVPGDMPTMMAGLACGEPCGIGWEILRDHADFYVTITDAMAANAMRLLGRPSGTDARVVSGESGAATLGFLAEVRSNPQHEELRKLLKLDAQSKVLLFSTEGATDKANYERILQEGYEK